MPTFRFTKRVPKSAALELGKSFVLVPAGKKRVAPINTPPPTHAITVGKTAMFMHDGVMVAGVIAECANGKARLKLAVPDDNGLLMVSDVTVEVDEAALVPCDAVHSDRKITAWQTNETLLSDGTKGIAVKDPVTGKITDYTDVGFIGYGSTFVNVTPRDRDGDGVLNGAFTETIKDFMRNPVMLYDHRNSVDNIAGSYTQVMQDDIGLRVAGKVSNAPEMRRIRFLIMEGHLKTLSMGGVFLFGPDGHTIEKVYLFEISLVAIPANPDALFQSRSLDLETAAKCFRVRSGKAIKAA